MPELCAWLELFVGERGNGRAKESRGKNPGKQKYYDSAKDWENSCSGRENYLYFFTIIADILFGYCVRCVGGMNEDDPKPKHHKPCKHKNDLV